jgi:S1-C subfamily serine protease
VKKGKKSGPYAEFAKGHPNIGDKVYTVGAPLGDKGTLTGGIISNFEYKKKLIKYRFTSPVFFGNSGGGIFNEKMELIGVTISMYFMRLGFATVVVPGAGLAASLKSIKEIM